MEGGKIFGKVQKSWKKSMRFLYKDCYKNMNQYSIYCFLLFFSWFYVWQHLTGRHLKVLCVWLVRCLELGGGGVNGNI